MTAQSPRRTKIFGFHNGPPSGDAVAYAIAENGEVVASHFCSHEAWARHDLGMDGHCDWKHDAYNKRFPDGWDVEFVPHDQIKTHPGLAEAYRLNQIDAAKEQPPQEHNGNG